MTDPDPIARALDVSAWLRVRHLAATQPNIDAAFRALADDDHIPAAPNPYEQGLKTLRAATATDASRFEDEWKASRLRELEATRTALDAETPEPRLTTAELAEWTPPNAYAAGIKALQMKEHK
jgi:hypothetical protein